jgi:hypothetical protein
MISNTTFINCSSSFHINNGTAVLVHKHHAMKVYSRRGGKASLLMRLVIISSISYKP